MNWPQAELCGGCNSILLDQAKYMARANEMAQPQDQRKQIEAAQKGLYISLALVGLVVAFGFYMVFLRPAAKPTDQVAQTPAATQTPAPSNSNTEFKADYSGLEEDAKRVSNQQYVPFPVATPPKYVTCTMERGLDGKPATVCK